MKGQNERVFVQGLQLPRMHEPSDEDVMEVMAGCGWVERNTRFRFGEEVPATVKMFLMKYRDIFDVGAVYGVKTERLAGMSQAGMTQTFTDNVGLEDLVRQLAGQLLGEWYDPVLVLGAERKFA